MEFLGYSQILLAVVCFLFFSHFKNKGLPTNWPLIGMLPSLFVNLHRLHDWSTEILSQTGCTFVLKGPWFTNMNVLATSDPANIRYITSTNFSNYPKGSEFNEMFDILGDGIANADGDSWKTQRKLLNTLITNFKFQRFSEKIGLQKVENGMIPILEHISDEGLVVDLQDLLKRFTFDSTMLLLSGIDPGCLSNELPNISFTDAFDDAQDVILYRHFMPTSIWKLQRWLGIGTEKKMNKAWEIIDDYLAQCISTKREQLSKSAKDKEEDDSFDLLSAYIEDVETFGSNSNKFLRDTVFNFMLAGRDTVSATLTWFFWLVSTNPLVESKIVEELKSKCCSVKEDSTKGRMFHMEELSGMVYLHGALCETLRLFPPIPFEHKSPLRSDILPSGHKVNPKTKIVPFLYSMGRMEGIWGKDCLEFKPERWISQQGGIKYEASYKFTAFNSGPRTCIGKDIAFTQMKLVAATLLYNYKFEVVEGHPVSPKNTIVLYMSHGLNVRVERRSI